MDGRRASHTPMASMRKIAEARPPFIAWRWMGSKFSRS
jgi:hypothetical protein